MRADIAPIVEEDKDPAKIRAALNKGCGGVIVSQAIPADVAQEWVAVLSSPLARSSAYRDALTHGEQAGLIWSQDDKVFDNTRRWLREQFEWAAGARLCRTPQSPQARNTLVRLWMNSAQSLPWHIDNAFSEIYPDIHLHIAGDGMMLANPPREMKMNVSNGRTSPALMLPDGHEALKTSYHDVEGRAQEHALKLTAYLQERGVLMQALAPGQMLFFNDKCLHRSAAEPTARLRPAIF